MQAPVAVLFDIINYGKIYRQGAGTSCRTYIILSIIAKDLPTRCRHQLPYFFDSFNYDKIYRQGAGTSCHTYIILSIIAKDLPTRCRHQLPYFFDIFFCVKIYRQGACRHQLPYLHNFNCYRQRFTDKVQAPVAVLF